MPPADSAVRKGPTAPPSSERAKRRLPSQACSSCQARRVSCDGGQPHCGPCMKTSRIPLNILNPCSYPIPPSSPYAPPPPPSTSMLPALMPMSIAPSGSEADRTTVAARRVERGKRVQGLEDRMKSLEQAIVARQHIQQPSSLENSSVSSPQDNNTPSPAGSGGSSNHRSSTSNGHPATRSSRSPPAPPPKARIPELTPILLPIPISLAPSSLPPSSVTLPSATASSSAVPHQPAPAKDVLERNTLHHQQQKAAFLQHKQNLENLQEFQKRHFPPAIDRSKWQSGSNGDSMMSAVLESNGANGPDGRSRSVDGVPFVAPIYLRDRYTLPGTSPSIDAASPVDNPLSNNSSPTTYPSISYGPPPLSINSSRRPSVVPAAEPLSTLPTPPTFGSFSWDSSTSSPSDYANLPGSATTVASTSSFLDDPSDFTNADWTHFSAPPPPPPVPSTSQARKPSRHSLPGPSAITIPPPTTTSSSSYNPPWSPAHSDMSFSATSAPSPSFAPRYPSSAPTSSAVGAISYNPNLFGGTSSSSSSSNLNKYTSPHLQYATPSSSVPVGGGALKSAFSNHSLDPRLHPQNQSQYDWNDWTASSSTSSGGSGSLGGGYQLPNELRGYTNGHGSRAYEESHGMLGAAGDYAMHSWSNGDFARAGV